jgi:hypothetical protein
MRRNAPSRETWLAIGIGSAVLLSGMAIYGLTRPLPPIPAVQKWNQRPLRMLQGLPGTIAFPRGESYIVASPDVLLQAQAQRGNESHLILVPLVTDGPAYTLETVVIEQGSGRTFQIQIHARPITDYVESPGLSGVRPP